MKCPDCKTLLIQISIHRYECSLCDFKVDMKKHLEKVRGEVKEKIDKAKLN